MVLYASSSVVTSMLTKMLQLQSKGKVLWRTTKRPSPLFHHIPFPGAMAT